MIIMLVVLAAVQETPDSEENDTWEEPRPEVGWVGVSEVCVILKDIIDSEVDASWVGDTLVADEAWKACKYARQIPMCEYTIRQKCNQSKTSEDERS